MIEERKVIVPDEFVFKGKHNLFMASERDTTVWRLFHEACIGYRFVSRLDGEPVSKEAIFCRHRKNPNLIKMAEGKDQSMYRRVDADDFTNGILQRGLKPDLATGKYMKEEQGMLFSEDMLNESMIIESNEE